VLVFTSAFAPPMSPHQSPITQQGGLHSASGAMRSAPWVSNQGSCRSSRRMMRIIVAEQHLLDAIPAGCHPDCGARINVSANAS